jgi:hypothetical protein
LQKAARAPAARREAQRRQGRETTQAEAEALRRDDLKEISVKESRKGSCTYRMDGASATGRDASGSDRKIDAKAAQKEGQGDEGMKKNLKVKDELPSAGKMKESGINTDAIDSKQLLDDISCLVENSRCRVAQSVNSELVMLYWQIGKRISEDLPAENRAEYGAKVVEVVSESLTAEYGKGFRRSNVFHMRRFSTMPR